MNVINAIRLGVFVLSTLPPLEKLRKKIDAAKAAGDDAAEIEAIRLAENFWGACIYEHYGVAVDASGERELPSGGVLFVGNHEGYGDIPLMMVAVPSKQFGFVAKDELSKLPIFSKWIVRIRSLMLVRGAPKEALRVFAEGEDLLKRGFSLAIFPEGHRAKGRGVQPFQKGSLRLALKAGVPIVPVSIKGSYDCFEKYGFPRKGRVRVHIHPAIETADIAKSEEGALSERVENIIKAKIEEWENE